MTEVQRAEAKRLGTRVESDTGTDDADAALLWETGFNFSDKRASRHHLVHKNPCYVLSRQ